MCSFCPKCYPSAGFPAEDPLAVPLDEFSPILPVPVGLRDEGRSYPRLFGFHVGGTFCRCPQDEPEPEPEPEDQ